MTSPARSLGAQYDFRILGTFHAGPKDGEPWAGLQPLHRSALAVLLLRSNQPCSTAWLQTALWTPDEPGAHGLGPLLKCISRVRRALGPAAVRLETVGEEGSAPAYRVGRGYRLRVLPGELDVDDFTTACDGGLSALGGGDPALAVRLLQHAAGLWGPGDQPFPILPRTGPVRAATAPLREQRRMAAEVLIDARLALGEHRQLLGPLRTAMLADPRAERACGQLMQALAGCGLRTEAITAFTRCRRAVIDRLGVEPGPELVAIHQQILRGRPGGEPAGTPASGDPVFPMRQQLTSRQAGRSQVRLAAASVPPVSDEGTSGESAGVSGEPREPLCQAPADIPDFTGRQAETAAIARTLTRRAAGGAVPTAVICGPPGSGKTTLAAHIAAALAPMFPDGQLFLELGGTRTSPADPFHLLGDVLRALGMPPAQIPGSLAARTAEYRSWLARRRVLVIADDAAAAEQLLCLIPAGAGNALLATSRRQVAGIAGARLFDVGGLACSEATDLLASMIGRDRLDSDPDASARIASSCGHMPLAVRIAGARLAVRPAMPLQMLADLLADHRHRLDELAIGDLAVRASFALSYHSLGARGQRAFMLLALAAPGSFGEWELDALLDDGPADYPGPRAAGELADDCLLTPAGAGPGPQLRYRMHDLLRDYADECLAGLPAEDKAAAEQRLLRGWLQLACRAAGGLPGVAFLGPRRCEASDGETGILPDATAAALTADPARWFEAERQRLLHATARAAATRPRLAAALARAQYPSQYAQGWHEDAEQLWRLILAAAARQRDPAAEADAAYQLALVILVADRGRAAEAMALADWCLPYFVGAGDQRSQSLVQSLRAACAEARDELSLALQCSERALDLAQLACDQHAQFMSLNALGLTLARLSLHESAIMMCDGTLAIATELGEPGYEAMALGALGSVRLLAGQPEHVTGICERGAAVARALGDQLSEAQFLEQMADACMQQGRNDTAERLLSAALGTYRAHRITSRQAGCMLKIAVNCIALGDRARAAAIAQAAVSASADPGLAATRARACEVLRACGAVATAAG